MHLCLTVICASVYAVNKSETLKNYSLWVTYIYHPFSNLQEKTANEVQEPFVNPLMKPVTNCLMNKLADRCMQFGYGAQEPMAP